MNGFQLGWVDFSKEQRNKVLNVINLLSEPGAVDELGVGIVRDAFANVFFPGTSTIQTRAKYFLLTPYILNELERERGMKPEKMIKRLHEQELDLIEVLLKSGETGVIGETAGRKLKRKPSDIYWNGIRTYEIFTKGKMSIYDYCRVACLVKNNKQRLKSQGSINKKDDDVDGDDSDAISGELSAGVWNLPEIPANWRDDLSIRLTKEEAEFLRMQIKTACRGSLLGHILETNNTDFLHCKSFDDIEKMIGDFPDDLKADYMMAKQFSDFIFGAHLHYNVILSKGEDEDLNEKWHLWRAKINDYSSLDLHKILFERFKFTNGKLINFLLDYQDTLKRNDIDQLNKLLIRRERRLKGDKRSKLYNASEFVYNDWVGIDKLQYRLRNAKNILEDIFVGLGEYHA